MAMNHIVNFILQTNDEELSSEKIETVKQAFVDTIAVTIAAENEALSTILRRLNQNSDSELASTTIETAIMNDVEDYAFTFGTMSHILDYDDVNFTFLGHPSAALIPIILALSKDNNISGQKMIEAYVVGFEVQAKIGAVMSGKQYKMGWHTTSTIGIFGAVSAASKLLNFNEAQIKHAIGMAGSFASGIRKNFGTMTKPIHVGLLAKNAITIAKLVENGVKSNENIFTEPLSIDVITTNQKLDFSSLNELGAVWEIEESNIFFKKYPCCTFTHRSIDAMLRLVSTYKLDEKEINKIEAFVHPSVPKVLIYKEPENETEAQFSLYYCLAAAFIDKEVNLSTFTIDKINRSAIEKLINKIQVKVDDTQLQYREEQMAKVTIYTEEQVYEKNVHYPSGHPENPLTDYEFKQKFIDCTNNHYTSDDVRLMYHRLMNLDKQNYADIEEVLLRIK